MRDLGTEQNWVSFENVVFLDFLNVGHAYYYVLFVCFWLCSGSLSSQLKFHFLVCSFKFLHNVPFGD